MLVKPFAAMKDPPEAVEIQVSKEGPGRNCWRWSIWGGSTLVSRAERGFAGAEAAYEDGRRVLNRWRPNSLAKSRLQSRVSLVTDRAAGRGCPG